MRAKNNGFNFLPGTAINLQEKGVSKPPRRLQAARLAPALRGEGRVWPLPPGARPQGWGGRRSPGPAPGAGTGVSSAQAWASRARPRAGAMAQRLWACNTCASTHTGLCPGTSPLAAPGTGHFPPLAPSPRGGREERGANSPPGFQGDGRSRNGCEAALPPARAGSRQQRHEPACSRAPHGTRGQSAGSAAAGSALEPSARGAERPSSRHIPALPAPSPAPASLARREARTVLPSRAA